jgi:transposase-like protein|tara:strand:- start:2104 stop:2784 length:681 start_codon:yes stop_codon:yes gene_type:complete
MTVRNRYAIRSKISEKKFRQLVRLFSLDLDAVQISELTGLNRNTINRYLAAMRARIAESCEAESPFSGEIEVDESYFGARRVKGKRGRGAYGKTIVFGIFKRNGKVYTEIVPDVRRKTLQDIIRGKNELESIIHSDGWRGYHGLVDLGYKKHFRVDHGRNEFANERMHINSIESFWAYAKTRLSKFRGIRKESFYCHLKECEFRFNYRHENLYQIMLKIFRNKPLF